MAELTVVIVSWNVRDLLAACLRSLFADLERWGGAAEVWVVDNGSTDGTPEMVARDFPPVRLIASEENLGFAAGNNRAMREILGEGAPQVAGRGARGAGRGAQVAGRRAQSAGRRVHVWLLNPDTEVLPGATAALVEALESHPRAGVVGAKLLYPDGSLQHSAFRFPGLLQLAFDLFPLPARLYETPLNGRYPRRLYEGTAPFPVDHPLGAAMMVRTEAIRQVGLLDEGFRMYCEEIDWCWRMRKAGWKALCVPTAQVVHHAGQSTKQVPIPSFVNLWTSRARLYRKHHGPVRRRLARALVRMGMRRRMRGASQEWRGA
ncbi:MAG TPA: glycosyltransferase family 2 protein, partial [Chloroflexi bacterium]|nr:glycosyltransferase family 2 protein [Chloroflexota bacterium]